MAENNNTMFIGVAQIQRDWGISRSKAYQIIKDLNAELKKKNPTALVVSGRVNRFWNTGKIKASQKRGEYAHKGTHINVSNLIIVPFRVLINQLCNRRHYEQ